MPTCSQKDVLALSGAGVRLVSEQGCGIRETLKHSPPLALCVLGRCLENTRSFPAPECGVCCPAGGGNRALVLFSGLLQCTVCA